MYHIFELVISKFYWCWLITHTHKGAENHKIHNTRRWFRHTPVATEPWTISKAILKTRRNITVSGYFSQMSWVVWNIRYIHRYKRITEVFRYRADQRTWVWHPIWQYTHRTRGKEYTPCNMFWNARDRSTIWQIHCWCFFIRPYTRQKRNGNDR